MSDRTIRIAIAGVGNCASSLVQGITFYASPDAHTTGLLHPDLGGYRVADIEPVAAFDVDVRKVGRPLEEAIFAPPNNTTVFHRAVNASNVTVQMGPVLDGVSEQMLRHPVERRFEPAKLDPVNVERVLRDSGAEILLNYMPVGAQQATEFYARACLEAGVSLVNCVPCFIVSDPAWSKRFRERGIPCVGD